LSHTPVGLKEWFYICGQSLAACTNGKVFHEPLGEFPRWREALLAFYPAELVERIVVIVLEWEKELSEKYPNILKRGRPLFSAEDTAFATSFETYLKGELITYSRKTLELYLANVLQQKSENINGSEITHAHTIKQYGFKSLKEANEKLKPRT
jgi:hypothetical protein